MLLKCNKEFLCAVLFFIVISLTYVKGCYADEMNSVFDDGRSKAPVTVTSIDSDGNVGSSCMGKYKVSLPTGKNLDASSVIDSQLYNPVSLNKEWYVIDHVGVKDSSYSGERHIVKRESGIQWFGYDMPPYNDMMLRRCNNFETINVKQAPVRADWHTVNGSGILFGVNLSENPTAYDVSVSSDIGFSGYAYVATLDKIEIRKYDNTTISDFCNGVSEYSVLYSENKTCNSQSLTISKGNNSDYNFYIGKRKLDTSLSVNEISGEYIGAIVDYEEHNCNSLSTVFMFNYTVDGVNYFN